MKILVDENMPYARELFSRLGNVKAVPGRPIPVNELDDADALMVRSVTKVNEALLSGKAVKFVGYWPTDGYEFTSPKPVIADGQLFVGLALDETNQYDLSDERIQSWCEQILGEMAEHFS